MGRAVVEGGALRAAHQPPEAGELSARMPALDGVRGLAVLLVVLYHFTALVGTGSTFVDEVFSKVAATGWAGVDLFFVLSGFLITGILYDSKPVAEYYFRNFYARRTLRIFPVFYLFLFALVVLLPLIQPMEHAASNAVSDKAIWYATYLTNVHVDVDPLRRPDFFLTSHLWSLAVEEQFYLVWPAVVLLFGRRKLMAICGLVIVWAFALRIGMDAAGVAHYVTHEITPARMDALAVGALIALAFREPADFRMLTRWAWPVAAAASVALLVLFFSRSRLSPFDLWVQLVGYTALAFLFGALLLATITNALNARPQRVFTFRPLRWLGKYSYALYLFHWPVAALLSRRTDIPGSVPEVLGSSLPGELLFVAAAGALSLGAAWLSWQLWEKQFLKMKRLFPYARKGRAPAGEVVVPAPVPVEGA